MRLRKPISQAANYEVRSVTHQTYTAESFSQTYQTDDPIIEQLNFYFVPC